jgi:hypothetical protein
MEVRADLAVRERLRERGVVLAARTLWVQHPLSPGEDWHLVLRAGHPRLRIRSGTTLKTVDGRVEATVTSVRPGSRAPLVVLRVTRAKRAAAALPIGEVIDWCCTVDYRRGHAG